MAFFAAIVVARLLVGTIVALVVAIAGVAVIGWLLRGESKAPAQPPRIVVRDPDASETGAASTHADERKPAERR